MSFDTLGLSADLLRAVSDQGYSEPTPVQRLSIPAVLAGGDVMSRAQTGTGKTAGFTLPILQRLSEAPRKRERRTARVLVLTPTRELAAQVGASVRTYGRYTRSRCAVVFGGAGFGGQIDALRHGVEVLVATPGRLLDHVERRTVDLSKVEVLVLDEADRMLDMGFLPDIRRVLAQLPKERQNLLFSATFPKEIRELADRLLDDPERIEIAPERTTADTVAQVVHPVDRPRKTELLTKLITEGRWNQVLVFARTRRGADRLARKLKQAGLRADAIHGDKTQGARTRALTGFKRGSIRVLVATDIAARGLDIRELPHVVNYDLPHVPEDYVHRIGRTGRAGRDGRAVSLVDAEDMTRLRPIEKLLKRSVEREVIDGFTPTLTEAPADKPARGRRPRRNTGGAPGGPRRSRGKSAQSAAPAARGRRRPRRRRGSDSRSFSAAS